MLQILNKDKLENLLIVKWTEFIDVSQLMKFIIENTKKQQSHFGCISNTEIKPKGNQITISRFDLTSQGFIIWVEFQIPLEEKMAFGTTELLINSAGILTHIQTIGNMYFK